MSDFFNLNMEGQDILNCLANLSSDEVFTSSKLANEMLDLLPQELFTSPDTKFLDPCCKSGVFLREIAKRLNKGLENWEPDLQKRIDHIFKEQLFAIATTQLTALLSRRSVYCSKYPNSKYSVCKFDNVEGNIRYRRIAHTFKDNKCIYCSATRDKYDRDSSLENYAYEFIHMKNPQEVLNMKFDVVIGNPPYQLSDGGGVGSSAMPLYNQFIIEAKKLNPKFLIMIIPSRWMTGGKGLDKFRDEMIHDKRFNVLHDFADSNECFKGVDIKGGVCYFRWDRDYNGKCECYRHDSDGVRKSKRFLCEEGDDIFIRDDRLISLKTKVWKSNKSDSVSKIVSYRNPYGLFADSFVNASKYNLPNFSNTKIDDGYRVLGLGTGQKRSWKYISNDYPLPKKPNLFSYKVFISKAYGCGEIGEVPSTPVLGTPGDLCTETFLQIGPFNSELKAHNFMSYLQSKFFRALVGIAKQTQNTTLKIYQFVPIQDFSQNSDIDWSKPIAEIDQQLYKKYNLSADDIAFIETKIKPMDLNGDYYECSY